MMLVIKYNDMLDWILNDIKWIVGWSVDMFSCEERDAQLGDAWVKVF